MNFFLANYLELSLVVSIFASVINSDKDLVPVTTDLYGRRVQGTPKKGVYIQKRKEEGNNRIMKRIIWTLFSFVFTMWSMNVNAFEYEGISYDVLSKEDKTVCVARQLSTDQIKGDVRIPSEVSYGGTQYTVTGIVGWAFASCDQMTSIAIPATIQDIGYFAFSGCIQSHLNNHK